MTNRIEKQQKPHIRSICKSSTKLWTVELIQRRRCDMRTFHSSGAIVFALAKRVNLVLYCGKCLRMTVVRYRSSPSESKFCRGGGAVRDPCGIGTGSGGSAHLHVQCFNLVFAILGQDRVRDDHRAMLERPNAVHGETGTFASVCGRPSKNANEEARTILASKSQCRTATQTPS
jgi:hypothetical protein